MTAQNHTTHPQAPNNSAEMVMNQDTRAESSSTTPPTKEKYFFPRQPSNDTKPRRTRNWWIIGGSVVVVLFIISTILNILTPPDPNRAVPTLENPLPAPSFSPFSSPASITDDVVFTGITPTIPKELVVYATTPIGVTLKTAMDQAILTYSLKPVGGVENVWISTDQTHTLYYSPETLMVSLNRVLPEETPSRLVSEEAAIAAAKTALTKLGVDANNPLLAYSVEYVAGDSEFFTVDDKTQAEFVQVTINTTINGLPVSLEKLTQTSSSITLTTTDLSPFKIQLGANLISAQPTHKQATISLSQAVAAIKNKQFQTVNSYLATPTATETESFRGTQLNSVFLEYRLIEQQNMLFPYYHFTGKTTEGYESGIYAIELIVPAIEIAPPQNQS